MDALTLSLIALGAVGVLFFAYAALVEVRKGAARKKPGAATPTSSSPTAPVAASAAAPAGPAAVEARSAPGSAPAKPAATLGGIAVMVGDFDRDAALRAGGVDDDAFDRLVSENQIAFDAATARYFVPESARSAALAALPASSVREARFRHAAYYTEMAQLTPAVSPDGGKHAGAGVAVLDSERHHFAAAFEFLSRESGVEHRLLELVTAAIKTRATPEDPQVAISWFVAAAAAARVTGGRESARDVLIALGASTSEAGDQARAREYQEQALALARELGDRHSEGRALANLALTWHRGGEPRRATELYEQALVVIRETGDRGREMLALAALGKAWGEAGDHARAVEQFTALRELAAAAGDRGGEGAALSYLGDEQLRIGEPNTAIPLFEQQRGIATAARDLRLEAGALERLGRAYRQLGNHDKALECFSRLVDVAHLLRDPIAGVRAMGELGLAHQALDRTSKAFECFEEQLRVARKFKDREGEALALLNGARIVHYRGQVLDAVTRASAALPILEALRRPDLEKVRAEVDSWRSQASR